MTPSNLKIKLKLKLSSYTFIRGHSTSDKSIVELSTNALCLTKKNIRKTAYAEGNTTLETTSIVLATRIGFSIILRRSCKKGVIK